MTFYSIFLQNRQFLVALGKQKYTCLYSLTQSYKHHFKGCQPWSYVTIGHM